ncbi:MAG: Hemolysins and related proteins containing CBS domains [uncultured Gemmatimonadetes bacterium]|uniref:Hemolysins and related proteins containing CBS domains n=1 Tax=uncultured Gemmatimonadota bacterium TaxID=203437 RepID=A0A6J4KV44_9BACT|nr:MAG: Hemolysins and related proteins containing CBS domains [uncultured Gemmatimonadota bacterium]
MVRAPFLLAPRMDPDPSSLSILAVPALVLANALLVAAEFALLSVRRTRIEQHVRQGDPRAARVLPALGKLEELLFAGQVGRSLVSILLGIVALDASRAFLAPRMRPDLAFTADAIAIGVVVALHATLGQQIPKLVAVHRSEHVAAVLGYPLLRALSILGWPLLRPLEWLVRLALRPLGLHGAGFAHLNEPDDELRMLVAAGGDPTEIEEEEREMIRGVFGFSDTVAREVMTPRTAMAAIPVDASFEQLLDVFFEEGHSRLPVYEGTIDTIVGVVLIKDLFPLLRDAERRAGFAMRAVMRPPYFVPETKPVSDILSELRQQSVHLAIVLDEFGGTYGLVTMEDLLEEIVGEINDEFDVAEPEFEPTPEGDTLIDGAVSLSEVNDRFDLHLPVEEFDTLGGYVFGTLGRVPVEGDIVGIPGVEGEWELRVEEVEERRVKCVRLRHPAPVTEAVE